MNTLRAPVPTSLPRTYDVQRHCGVVFEIRNAEQPSKSFSPSTPRILSIRISDHQSMDCGKNDRVCIKRETTCHVRKILRILIRLERIKHLNLDDFVSIVVIDSFKTIKLVKVIF